MKRSEQDCKCPAERGIAEEEAFRRSVERKSKEFAEKSAEVYAKIRLAEGQIRM